MASQYVFYSGIFWLCIWIIFCLQCNDSFVIRDELDYPEVPSQRPRRCSILRTALKNGRVKLRSRARIAKFSCNPGFELVGKRFATCIRGQWNYPVPICVASGCRSIHSLKNGAVVYMYNRALATFSCDPGYVVQGSPSLYCDGRLWNSTAPSCEVVTTKPMLACDFESEDLCGWTHDPSHDFDWRRHQFSTPSGHVGTGPAYDHTFGIGRNGTYMFIETSSPRKENDTARLYSPVYPPEAAVGCFVFWYHMYGATTGFLRIFVKGESQVLSELKPLWEKHGEQGNQWLRGAFPLPELHENFQIIIEGIRGSSYVGDTAIDDVSIRENDCWSSLVPSDYPFSCFNHCGDSSWLNSNCSCVPECKANFSCCDDFEQICTTRKDNNTEEEVFTLLPSIPPYESTEKVTLIPSYPSLISTTSTRTPTSPRLTTTTYNKSTSPSLNITRIPSPISTSIIRFNGTARTTSTIPTTVLFTKSFKTSISPQIKMTTSATKFWPTKPAPTSSRPIYRTGTSFPTTSYGEMNKTSSFVLDLTTYTIPSTKTSTTPPTSTTQPTKGTTTQKSTFKSTSKSIPISRQTTGPALFTSTPVYRSTYTSAPVSPSNPRKLWSTLMWCIGSTPYPWVRALCNYSTITLPSILVTSTTPPLSTTNRDMTAATKSTSIYQRPSVSVTEFVAKPSTTSTTKKLVFFTSTVKPSTETSTGQKTTAIFTNKLVTTPQIARVSILQLSTKEGNSSQVPTSRSTEATFSSTWHLNYRTMKPIYTMTTVSPKKPSQTAAEFSASASLNASTTQQSSQDGFSPTPFKTLTKEPVFNQNSSETTSVASITIISTSPTVTITKFDDTNKIPTINTTGVSDISSEVNEVNSESNEIPNKPASSASRSGNKTASGFSKNTVIGIVACGSILLLCVIAFAIARIRRKRQNKLAEDSEMRFLNDNEVVEFLDSCKPPAPEKVEKRKKPSPRSCCHSDDEKVMEEDPISSRPDEKLLGEG